jgi:hypothetical protein
MEIYPTCDISSHLIKCRPGPYSQPGSAERDRLHMGTCRTWEAIPYSRSIHELKIKVILVILKCKDIDLRSETHETVCGRVSKNEGVAECYWCHQHRNLC